MKRQDVVQAIKIIGEDFERVLIYVHSEDYVAGYRQAIKDLMHWFEYEPYRGEKPKEKRMVLFGGTRGRRHEGS